MARIFIYDGREFPDPDPHLTVEEVRRQLAEFFPELVNAETRETQRGDDTLYTFAKRIGTKGGSRPPDVVTILRQVPEKRLGILALAAELLDQQGELDLDAAVGQQAEITLAIAEAETYARANRRAAEAIRQLPPR